MPYTATLINNTLDKNLYKITLRLINKNNQRLSEEFFAP